ncbi:DUF2946 family protein [Bradyrhizobium sp. AUGA SZCCT0431]|uniref:DUF2946 family protein n=1 Tax=Bradyrhizobium sp. AUGA SZCCT0431 TaxID=2807674 RepID=UPI001BA4D0FA|nr:DUF2946 family protein [Bradyrhizobium sp. AUGA SZCCT0431]MBR1145398.1 hypothetical protein [Bradyrhizobium sp. AUGA SZCCT0431]
MKWFRDNVKHGSRLALLALAIQFALSFGHCHAVAAAIAISLTQVDLDHAPIPVAPDAASEAARTQPPSNHDTDHPAEACAICAVITLANNLVFPAPPLLLLPQAIELLYLTTDAEFAHLSSVRSPFQSRAPPAS